MGGKTLDAGDSYTVTKDATFIAQWKEKNTTPTPATNPLKGTWLSGLVQ
jgi:hypothetical protein